MEELKQLIELIQVLPALALWVLVGFFAYKVIVVGSVYGVIRYVVEKLHDYLVQRKTHYVDIRGRLDALVIASPDALIPQIKRIVGVRSYSSAFIHNTDVEWLRQAIDEKLARDQAESLARRPSASKPSNA